jgi:hypothetical protein
MRRPRPTRGYRAKRERERERERPKYKSELTRKYGRTDYYKRSSYILCSASANTLSFYFVSSDVRMFLPLAVIWQLTQSNPQK